MHEHIIGLLWDIDYGELATAHDVAVNIVDIRNLNNASKQYGYSFTKQEYSPKQYSDLRCSNNLNRFKYCPECGEKIDWKQVRVEIEEELEVTGYAEKN